VRRQAICLGEAVQPEHTAHSLKGGVGALGARTASLTCQLETIGCKGHLERAPAVLYQLPVFGATKGAEDL
jgi:hypothetical protein